MKAAKLALVLLMLAATGAWAQMAAEELVKSGEEHYRQGDYDQAVRDFKEAIRL